jgi:PAS domain-containing protein
VLHVIALFHVVARGCARLHLVCKTALGMCPKSQIALSAERILGMFVSISQQIEAKSASAEFPKSEPGMDPKRWLAAIVESSDDAILRESLRGLITSWNAGATRILGYSLEEAIGKPIRWFAWPDEEDRIEELLQRLRLSLRCWCPL